MPGEDFEKLRKFYEEGEGRLIFIPLKDGAISMVEIEGDDTIYSLGKEKGIGFFRPGKPDKPDTYMKFTPSAIDYLVESGSVQDYAERLAECIQYAPLKKVSSDPNKKVDFKLTTSMIGAIRKGYWEMLKMGGPKIIKMIKQSGLKIPKGLK